MEAVCPNFPDVYPIATSYRTLPVTHRSEVEEWKSLKTPVRLGLRQKYLAADPKPQG